MRRFLLQPVSVLAVALALLGLMACSSTTPPEKADIQAVVPEPDSVETPVSLPPSPTDVSGMQGWLAEAYPNAAWLARIQKIEYVPGEVPDSGGSSNAIVVTTDLDYVSEMDEAETIWTAVSEAHLSWAKQFVLRYADGENIWAGPLVDQTP